MTRAPKTPVLKFQKMLAWLMVELVYGQAHFKIMRGLNCADRAVLDSASTFFDMTLAAHAESTQLAAARIFDRSRGVSIHTLLQAALNEAGTFRYGTSAEVRNFVIEAKACVEGLEPIVAAVRTRRNETIAHAAFRPIVDPKAYIAAGRMGYREFERLFLKIGSIANKLSMLYRGASVELEMPDWRDYEQALDLIADAKCEQARRYEAAHHTPAPFQLPRKCSERSIS